MFSNRMQTITIKKTTPNWPKTNFRDDGDLLNYLLKKYDIGKLTHLPTTELTNQRRKTWEETDQMNNEDFLDIR